MKRVKLFHLDLVKNPAKWRGLPLVEQLAHVGSEISRAMKWRGRDRKLYELSFYRALELLSLILEDEKNKGARLREVCRVKEVLIDWFYGGEVYGTTDEDWRKYFDELAWLVRRRYESS